MDFEINLPMDMFLLKMKDFIHHGFEITSSLHHSNQGYLGIGSNGTLHLFFPQKKKNIEEEKEEKKKWNKIKLHFSEKLKKYYKL